MGGACASSSSSKQQLDPPTRTQTPKQKRNPPSGFGSPVDGSWDPRRPSLGPGLPVSRPPCAPPRAQTGRNQPRTGPARDGHQNSKTKCNVLLGSRSPLGGSWGPNITIRGVLFRPGACVLRPPGASADPNGTISAQTGTAPKRARTHQKRGPTVLRHAPAGPTVPVYGQNPLGQRASCLFVVF